MLGGNSAADTLTQGLSMPIRCIDHCHGEPQTPHQAGMSLHTWLLPAQEARHLCCAIEAMNSQKAYLPPIAVTGAPVMI